VFGADAVAFLGNNSVSLAATLPHESCRPPGDSPTTIIDDAVLEALESLRFSSIQELAKLTCIPTTTVYRHLTQSLGFVVTRIYWVPHSLTAPQNVEGLTRSKELSHQLLSIKHHKWQFILTVGESWF
jgi:hypothetical protein